jgi:hypothetical protein
MHCIILLYSTMLCYTMLAILCYTMLYYAILYYTILFPSPIHTGNSLGLQPKSLRANMNGQLDKWAAQGVEGHFEQPTPWLTVRGSGGSGSGGSGGWWWWLNAAMPLCD